MKPILRGEFIDTTALLSTVASGEEINLTDVYSNLHTILHFVDRNNPTGPVPQNPASDPQYDNWEYGVSLWKKETYGIGEVTSSTTEEEPG
jgi:hypothetical protein